MLPVGRQARDGLPFWAAAGPILTISQAHSNWAAIRSGGSPGRDQMSKSGFRSLVHVVMAKFTLVCIFTFPKFPREDWESGQC